jgi:hypothetical protein
LALTSDLPTVNNATLTMNTSGTGLSGSQTFTANQASAATFTVASNATSANTISTIVARDASGNFSAGTITATLTGQASSVANSHSAGTYLTGSAYNGSAAQTWAVDATSANTASKVVARDASGNFSAGTITATLSGSATSATSASTSTTQGKTDASTNIATTAFSKWMFATTSTGGTLNWNDSSNTIPGVGTTLLLGTATNGPGGGNYYHPFNIEYSGINGTGNVTQMAIAYGSPGNELYMRGSYSGTFGSWVRFLNSNNYTSYAPTLTGSGASGSWGISITGSSASCTGNAATATTAGSAGGLYGSPSITVSGITASGDITTYRSGSPTTGVIYLGNNSGSRYLYYDGGSYILNGANLYVNGVQAVTNSGTWSINVTGSSGSCTGNAATITSQANSATITASVAANANQIVLRDGSGHLYGVYGFFSYLNMSHGASGSTTDTIFYSSGDDYIRKNNGTGFRASLNVPTRTGGDASGTWGISVTGNAATATNVAGIVQNSYTTYGNTATTTLKNSYYGMLYGSSTTHSQHMFDSGGNGGHYQEAYARWITYYSAGNASVGIMSSTTSSSYALYVTGSIYATANVTAYSDRRAKKNIETIDNALGKTNQLRGVYYEAIEEQVHDTAHHGKRLMGVIAQEVLEVVPEVVTYDKENDKYGVSYANMVGLLIEAVKELSDKVTEQDARIAKLEALVTKLIED